MARVLSRELFVERVAARLEVTTADLESTSLGGTGLDPVALHRLDEIVSSELGVELPEHVLSPASNIDEIYRAYALERVASDLRTTGSGS